MDFVFLSVAVEFGYHPLNCLHGPCSCYIWISQKYKKIDGQLISSLEKGIVLVTGFCCLFIFWIIFFFWWLCVCVKICQGKAQQKKKKGTEFCSETIHSYCSCKCDVDSAALEVVTLFAVSVKIGCCRKAQTRENCRSALTKNNPRKKLVYLNRNLHFCVRQRILAGKSLCDLCLHKSPR